MDAPRNIILTGFMGTGKSAVGRALARRLGRPFVDSDALIEERAGKAIAVIFREEGEAAFRRMESEVACELGRQRGLVIATGGGMLTDRANVAALGDADIFCLTAEPETILARILATDERPLLDAPDPGLRIRELLAERAEAYARFRQIPTDGQTVAEVVEVIRKQLEVSSKP